MYIHTLETSALLSNENYYDIQNTLKEKDKSKWVAEKNGMTYFGLSEKGIIIKFFRIKKKGYYAYSLTYRISARRVMENYNFVGLFNTKYYDELKNEVNRLLEEKCDLLPKLKHCSLRRLDFCINTRLENQEQVQAYIKTAKRANTPAHLTVYTAYNPTSKRKKPMKDDYTVHSSEYIAISIYNKYRQMKKEKNVNYSDRDLKDAENIVRIEIRCMEEKIKALKKKFNIETISEFFNNADMIGNYLYMYYLPKIFGKGKICTLNEAIKKIEMSGYRTENIEIMKDFIEEANLSRSAGKTVDLFKNYLGKKEVKRILYMFELIDTNYVTITNEDAKVFPDGYIPTPLELYEDFVNEKQ